MRYVGVTGTTRAIPFFSGCKVTKKILMSIYVLIIKADNTGKIGIYRFFEGKDMCANGLMGSR